MEKFRTALNKALELLAGLSMAVMVILTTYQVIARYIFNSLHLVGGAGRLSVRLEHPVWCHHRFR